MNSLAARPPADAVMATCLLSCFLWPKASPGRMKLSAFLTVASLVPSTVPGAQQGSIAAVYCYSVNEVMLLSQMYWVFISSSLKLFYYFLLQNIWKTTSKAALSVVNEKTQAPLDCDNSADRYVNVPWRNLAFLNMQMI